MIVLFKDIVFSSVQYIGITFELTLLVQTGNDKKITSYFRQILNIVFQIETASILMCNRGNLYILDKPLNYAIVNRKMQIFELNKLTALKMARSIFIRNAKCCYADTNIYNWTIIYEYFLDKIIALKSKRHTFRNSGQIRSMQTHNIHQVSSVAL